MDHSISASNQQLLQSTSMRSFFKLPFIFVLLLFFLSSIAENKIEEIFFYNIDGDEKNSLFSWMVVNFLSGFNIYLIYFVIATVMFIRCKLYEVNYRTILLMLIMVTLFLLLDYFIGFFIFDFLYHLIETVVTYLKQINYMSYDELRQTSDSLYQYPSFILMIVKFLLLMCIIRIMASIKFLNNSKIFSSKLTTNHQNTFFALLFSSLILIIPTLTLNNFFILTSMSWLNKVLMKIFLFICLI